MNIKDRLVRRNIDDQVQIGEIVRRTYAGQFGEILRAYINGKVTECLTYHQVNPSDRMPVTADRILGRAEGYQTVLNDLELMIETAEKLKQPQGELQEDEDYAEGKAQETGY